jgi:hypothetical protein
MNTLLTKPAGVTSYTTGFPAVLPKKCQSDWGRCESHVGEKRPRRRQLQPRQATALSPLLKAGLSSSRSD